MKHLLGFTLALMIGSFPVWAQKKETRNVPVFTTIAYRIPGTLYLRQGTPQKVEVEASEGTVAKITTEVTGSKLVIGTPEKWINHSWGDEKIVVYITVEKIEGIQVAGSGNVLAQGKLSTGDMDIKISGSGDVVAEIEVKGDLDIEITGSGNLDLKGGCNNFEGGMSGSGKIAYQGTIAGHMGLRVTGSGKVNASGSVKSIEMNISGSGKVMASGMESGKCDIRIAGSGDAEVFVKDELNAHITGSGSVSYKGNPTKVDSHASGSGHLRKM